ncbi:MAG: DUF268 domain-containing protein [bacterium]
MNRLAGGFSWGTPLPCFHEHLEESGSGKGDYFYQDLIVAQRIFKINPARHVDVGSRIDGFVAHVASFRPIEVIDIRPLLCKIPNVRFIQQNMMTPLCDHLVDYCDSLSCLHAIEHFGLGRYGDPLCIDGHLKGLQQLNKILKPNGKFYISVPIGPQRIEYNAHRVFSIKYLLDLFSEDYQLDRFSYVDDKGELHEDASLSSPQIETNFGCWYGCGIFELTKQ